MRAAADLRRRPGYLLLGVVTLVIGCKRDPAPPAPPPAAAGATAEERVRVFCTACHLYPPPDTLPREVWEAKVRTMYEIAQGDPDKVTAGFPPLDECVRHYEERAPESLRFVLSTAGRGPGRLRLKARPLKVHGLDPYPGVASVRWVRLLSRGAPELLVCEMRYGMVFLMRPLGVGSEAAVLLGRVPHPCRAEVVDLDQDGNLDVLVADLGTPTPSDVEKGRVVWLRHRGAGRFETVVLAEGLGRVADVRAADFDGDGDLDLVTAVFGWRRVGEILLLENRTRDYDHPDFSASTLDPRPGAIHVPIVDLNGDGHADIIALLSQQFETIVAYLGDGKGNFDARTLFTAEHPNWGSTGIEVLDLDGDADLDILFVNGDSLDDMVTKPYHGVQWLENVGGQRFAVHRLTDMYGATAVKAGDLDGDGDLDIVASAFLPFLRPETPGAELTESIIWLEHTAPGKFERHEIETLTTFHPALDVGDYDGDGDLDIIVGNMTMAKLETDTIEHSLILYENLGSGASD